MREIKNEAEFEKVIKEEEEKAEVLIAVLLDSGFFKLGTLSCLKAIGNIITKLGEEKGIAPEDLADVVANSMRDIIEWRRKKL